MTTPPPLKKDSAPGAPVPPPLPPGAAPALKEFVAQSLGIASTSDGGLQPELDRPELRRRGMKHDLTHLWTAYWFAIGLALAGLLGLSPGVYQMIEHVTHSGESSGVPRWAYLLFLLGAVQVAYAVYVGQLPDWSAIWMATLFTLLLAAGYATLIGYLMLTSEPYNGLGFLQLADTLRHKAVSWCFVALSANCLLTYLGGRSAAGWHRSHATLVAALRQKGA